MNLSGKIVLVTGSSRGIGRAIALKFASRGAHVIINYVKNRNAAEDVVKRIKIMGRRSIAIKADVSDPQQVRLLIERCINEFGRIDVLVNNAGIIRDRTLKTMSFEEWDSVIKVNLYGTYYCIKETLPYMIRQGGGKIINISSVVALIGNFGQANYIAAKAAIIGLTRALAKELAKYNILVNCVAPGFTETDMVQKVPPAILKKIVSRIPLKRLAHPDEIADAVIFLAENDYITGEVIIIDGGLSLAAL